MIELILSIIVFVAMMLLATMAEAMMKPEELSFTNEEGAIKEPKALVKSLFSEGTSGRPIVIGLVPAVVNFLLRKVPDLAVLFAVLLVGTMVYLCWWWHKEFEALNEFLVFAVMQVILFLELKATISLIAAKIGTEGIWQSVASITPVLLLIAALGFQAISGLAFNGKLRAKRWATVGLVAVLLLTALMNIKGGATMVTAAPEPWYHFFNSDLQNDEDKDNDFNFGPSAYTETTTAEEADKEFRKRISKDPALGAADIAWLDSIVKTRFLGVFYDEAEAQWDKAINDAKESWLKAGEDEYKKVTNTFFLYLDKAKKVEIIERTSGLDDQMYMNPVTIDGVPDVIVLETENHTGHFLRYTFEIKGEEFTVEYRLECGFQPVNVEAQMGIKPQNRNVVPTNNPTPTPEPTPTPNPRPLKNPSESNVLPNDDNGPGENTNSGGRESTKDLPTNSNHMTYPEYRETMEELKEINETQKVGGDSNTPSTPTPPDTEVSNNADSGTGNGGIDNKTPISSISTTGGEQLANDVNNAGQPWGGPKSN